MISFLKLIRYKNLLMVLLTMVLTRYTLLDHLIPNIELSGFDFVLFAISIVLITAYGYIINDLFDIKADQINKPEKVFIDHYISKKTALYLSILLGLVGFFIGFYVSYKNHKIYLLNYYLFSILILFLYSFSFKKIAFLGNLIVSFLCGFPILILYFLITGLSFTELNDVLIFDFPVLAYCLFAMFTTFIREIIKDIEDIDGDLKIKAKTLPIIIGRERASRVAFVFSSLLFIFFIIILQFLQNNYLFLGYGILLLILPQIYFMSKLWLAKSKKDFSKLSSFLKTIMLFGILSMLLFKFQ